jgi:hypothetical protein
VGSVPAGDQAGGHDLVADEPIVRAGVGGHADIGDVAGGVVGDGVVAVVGADRDDERLAVNAGDPGEERERLGQWPVGQVGARRDLHRAGHARLGELSLQRAAVGGADDEVIGGVRVGGLSVVEAVDRGAGHDLVCVGDGAV